MIEDQNDILTLRGSKLETLRQSARKQLTLWGIIACVGIGVLVILKNNAPTTDDDCETEIHALSC